MAIPPAALAQFEAHAGCASVANLVRVVGVTHHTVVGWRRRGFTASLHRGVDRLVGAPRSDEQALWAALLRCGPHAHAGPRSTCWLYGLEGFSELRIDVVLRAPHRSRATSFPVRTRSLSGRDRSTVRGFPALSAPRAIIELAHTLAPKALRLLIDSARRLRLLSIETIRRLALSLRDQPGCRLGARAVLKAVGTGTFEQESENEREIRDFLATTTLQLDWQVKDLIGGRRFDAVDRPARLILELDSRLWHSLGSDRDADGLRDLEAGEQVGDHRVFRLTLGMVRYHEEETRRRLDAIRAARLHGRDR